MSRYKKIYRDEQHERDRKRDRIRKTVDVFVALFWVAILAVLGVFQHNDYIVGAGLIVIGVVNGCYACFAFWILKHWRIVTVFDSDELWRNKYLFGRKMVEEETEKIAAGRKIVTFIVAMTAVFFSVAGIATLIGWL